MFRGMLLESPSEEVNSYEKKLPELMKIYLPVLFLPFFLVSCAEVRLQTLTAPPPTAKLRVYIQVLTATENTFWIRPHQVFEQETIRNTAKMFQERGIYEVVSQDDINAVLGGRRGLKKRDWARKDWGLAKQVGQAVHAEYALFVVRSKSAGTVYFEMVLINTETEKKFRVLARAPARHEIPLEEYVKVFRIFYRELFRSAKEDMLATAIRKGRFEMAGTSVPMASQPALSPVSAAPTETRPSTPPPLIKSSAVEKPTAAAKPGAPQSPPPPIPPLSASGEPTVPKPAPSDISLSPSSDQSSSFTTEFQVDLEKALQAEIRIEGRRQLAVYDLESGAQYKIVALILSEALREEIMKLDLFRLVNRENIVKVLEEMALQQTGLVDEKEAVKAGKGLAVQQIVLGRYGTLGKISVLQAKRVDVETQGALGIGSLKCDVGREDELLRHMAELAKEISGKK